MKHVEKTKSTVIMVIVFDVNLGNVHLNASVGKIPHSLNRQEASLSHFMLIATLCLTVNPAIPSYGYNHSKSR